MSMTRWWKAACLLIVAGATVSGAGLLGGRGSQAVEPRPQDPGKQVTDMPVAAATRGPFRLVVNDPGTLEATESEDLIARLPGNRTIGSIVSEGTRVKKGDAIVEFESAGSRRMLTNQQIATQGADASYRYAKLLRETAEIALREYEEGIYPQDKAALQSAVELARRTLKGVIDRQARLRLGQGKLDALLREQEKRSSTDIMVEVDLQDRLDAMEQAVAREQSALEQAESRLRILEKYTRPKTVSQLRSEVEKALSHELSKKQVFQEELNKETRLEKEVAACRLVAGIDGVVVYLEDPYHENPLRRVVIEKGALVHEGQVIARIVNVDAPMQFNSHVGEPLVDRLKVGQKAVVQVDAFPDETFTGVVTSIAPRPDPNRRTRSGYKVYPTLIKLENGHKSLRPGMNGRAEVTIVEREDSLTVPFEAILTYQDKTDVAVKKPGGGFEWRGVVLGEGDPTSRRVEIRKGLKPGEEVAIKPIELLSEFEKRQKGIGEPTKPGRRKAAGDAATEQPKM